MKLCLDCTLVGIDNFGGDIKCLPAANFNECEDICLNNTECRRWSFQSKPFTYKIGGEKLKKVPRGQCILKKEKPGYYNDKIRYQCGLVTGFKGPNQNFCDENGN